MGKKGKWITGYVMSDYVFAESRDRTDQSRELILEYARSLGCSPCLENIEQEMLSFPVPFAPPSGRLIVAIDNGRPAGVVGLKKVADNIGEMARLYVRPAYREKGHGKGLATRCLEAAEGAGYRAVRLYTLPTMETALAMYRKMGFREILPYTAHSIKGAVYMEYRFKPGNS